jgi:tRNA(Ile)-lysidine synthase TilS/MesJ
MKTPEQIESDQLRARLTKRFHKACADYGLIADGDRVLIGLSGGKDSLALVELLGRRAQIYKPRFEVLALHVRVKERAYSSDLSYLETFCAEAKVPLIIRDVEIGEKPDSSDFIEQKPKETNPCFLCAWYRRKTLFNVAQEMGCNKIAFGHHKDDVVQTMLMNLVFAGSFATMPPMLQLDKMPLRIIRPLCLIEENDLIRYAELRHYAKQQKLCPFEHVSARTQAKNLLEQMQRLNPNALDTLYNAMSNIKTTYLPQKI